MSVLALSPPSSFTLSREREREFRVYILSNNINNINTYDIQFGWSLLCCTRVYNSKTTTTKSNYKRVDSEFWVFSLFRDDIYKILLSCVWFTSVFGFFLFGQRGALARLPLAMLNRCVNVECLFCCCSCCCVLVWQEAHNFCTSTSEEKKTKTRKPAALLVNLLRLHCYTKYSTINIQIWIW